ncbi:hypothetical protein G7046_g2860 [Stylonectria norvegica]|nr:hypothetical protein G7046_g2860 [Stylonectria norvegica]
MSPEQSKKGCNFTDVNDARHQVIEPAYENYLKGSFPQLGPITFPSLEMLSPSEMRLVVTRDPSSKEVAHVHASKITDPKAINFTGYCPKEKCFVFKGEARLMDRFFDYTSTLLGNTATEDVMKTSAEARIPDTGLQAGLSYEEFAQRVEILEHYTWIRDDLRGAFAFKIREYVDIPDRNTYFGIDDMSDNGLPPTPSAYVAPMTPSEDGPPNPVLENEDPKTPIGHSNQSDSSLSPPPEVITTPPSMKRRYSCHGLDSTTSACGNDLGGKMPKGVAVEKPQTKTTAPRKIRISTRILARELA